MSACNQHSCRGTVDPVYTASKTCVPAEVGRPAPRSYELRLIGDSRRRTVVTVTAPLLATYCGPLIKGVSMKSSPRTPITFLVVAVLSGCGGGSSDPPAPTNQSPGGIWTVHYVVPSGANAGDTMQGQALVTETGEAFFAEINTTSGCTLIGFGQVNVDGSSASGSTNDTLVTLAQNANVNTSCSFPDGATSASSALSGTVVERSSFALTDTTTTALGMALGSETHTWTYSNLYAEKPSLATIAGNYADGSNTLTVDANGVVFEQDPTSGCVINGQISIVNPAYNAYAVSYTFASCTGSAAVLNGQSATGLGYYDDSVNPIQFVIGLHLTVSGQTVVVAGALNKM